MPKKQTAIKTRFAKHEDETQLIALFKELTDDPINLQIETVVGDENCHAVVLENKDGSVIGFGALVIHLIPLKGYVGRIEDVIIQEAFRGQGLGERLLDKLIEIARKQEIANITLNSNPKRIAARNLYLKKGFYLRDTGVFRLDLK
ncbi:MAG: GNAT family N-acetyltransferase [Candidatus Moranbacteria bacterium]|nr:GNAT family N-acetyltransferase [Candidatus Moranbacteria bacterium]